MENLKEFISSELEKADGFFILWDNEDNKWIDVHTSVLAQDEEVQNFVGLKTYKKYNAYGGGGLFLEISLIGWHYNGQVSAYQLNKYNMGQSHIEINSPLLIQLTSSEGVREDEKRLC